MATKLVLIPYLQRWDGTSLGLRLLSIPRGSPLDPLQNGAPASFANANFKFEVHILSDLDSLPTPGGNIVDTISSPPPTNASAIFQALATQFPIDPSPPTGIQKPPSSNVKKYLPLTYQTAVNYAGTNSNICFTDDTYTCMMSQSRSTYQKLPAPNPKWAWGRVIAITLRNTTLALATGLVRSLSVQLPDPSILKNGGYVYLNLASGSDGSGLLSISGGIKIYAARIPPLKAARDLFSSVFFPVVSPPPSEDYATIFAEAEDYDDGWAKAVHCTQAQQLDHLQEGSDGPRPAKELGIRIGWDDEQVAVWMNRQLDATQTFDSPLGVKGYRVDASVQGSNQWYSLVQASGPVPLPGAPVQTFDGELSVEVTPTQQYAQDQGDFWLPMYFTSWTGPALVTADETMLLLLGGIDLSAKQKIRGVAPGIDLRYGTTYSFRVRLADQTGGGPSVSDSPINPAPAPIGSLPFRRWVRPGSPTLISPAPSTFGPAPNFDNPPTSLTFQRPRLAYPAVECTGGYSNAIQLLIEDIPTATAAKREPSLFDPDVTAVSITVEVASFPQDPLATDGIYQPIYQTSKSFPSDPAAQLVLSISWQDFDQISDLVPDNTPNGPLILPTSRNLRVVVAAECKADPNLLYFGADDVRYGPNIYFEIGKHSTSETSLYQAQLPSLAINGFFFQPDTPTDPTLVAAQQTSGNPTSVPTDIASLAGNAFGLPSQGLTYYAAPGRRGVFACTGSLLHTISPDQSSITFSSKNDLSLHWIILIRLTLNRDWTWDGLALNGITLSPTDNNTNTPILSFSPSQSISTKLFATNAPTPDRTSTDLLIFDSIDPKPPTGAFPSELNPSYTITSSFSNPSIPPITQSPLTIRLPITTPPSQTPKLISAGLAFSLYARSADYSTTSPRQRSLWLEFDSAPLDPGDAYFGRVLFNAPDPLLTPTPAFSPTSQPILEPPLPVPPEPVRTIVPNEASDPAGLDAMQALIPADPDANSPTSPIVQYLLPLPPGTTSGSPELFGFYTYEFRVGHTSARWSTAKGRFGPPLRVTGVQHPAPPLVCNTARTKGTITVSAPFASAVLGNVLLNGALSLTTMWAMVYAQATLIDGSDNVNVLLVKQQMRGPRVLRDVTSAAGTGSSTGTGAASNTGTSTAGTATTTAPVPATSTTTAPTSATTPTPAGIGVGVSSMAGLTTPTYATATLNTKDVATALKALGFKDDANISVLAVELLPPTAGIADPMGTDLGKQRILRTSPLVKVPVIC